MTERFYRSRKNRVIGGVAGGLAEYWNLDPVLARVLFIIVALMTGIGLFLYIILWIIIPEEPFIYQEFGKETKDAGEKEKNSGNSDTEEKKTAGSNFEYKYNYENSFKKQNGSGRIIGGIFLIGLGLFFLAERIFPYFDFQDFLPLIFIGIGILLIVTSYRNKKNEY
ncbi:MAG: PspC domain-containing protein [Bacteroidetes bacterium]|nr:PspC domain-containing protein [Bacteroidota bacterium]